MCSRKRENRFREENIYRNHKSFQKLKIKKILIHRSHGAPNRINMAKLNFDTL